MAYAADLFGVRAMVCMPEQANPVKVESMRALGAEVVFWGRDFDICPKRPMIMNRARNVSMFGYGIRDITG